LRPGWDVLNKAGCVHKFNGRDKPKLNDYCLYLVDSVMEVCNIRKAGFTFCSHVDFSKLLFTPENVMDTQRIIGADIIMAFDECTPYPCDYNYARRSLDMTHRWLKRCCDRFDSTEPLYGYDHTLFPIVQGSVYKDLRAKSAEVIASFNRE